MKFFTVSSMNVAQEEGATPSAPGPKPFIHKSFRLLYVKDEKNKELGGQGKTQVQWRLWWKALIHHFHPRSNDRVSTDLTRRIFFFCPIYLNSHLPLVYSASLFFTVKKGVGSSFTANGQILHKVFLVERCHPSFSSQER